MLDREYIIQRIESDINGGVDLFNTVVGSTVTIFGSARVDKHSPHYLNAYEVAKRVGELGYNILTGGGPGVMEAGNLGGSQVKNRKIESIGLNIKLPKEQRANSYISKGYEFNEMCVRKSMLIYNSKIFVVFPGGFGTLDELFELLVLIQNRKLREVKIFLFDSEFFNPLINFLEASLLKSNMINSEDLKLFRVVDSANEVIQAL